MDLLLSWIHVCDFFWYRVPTVLYTFLTLTPKWPWLWESNFEKITLVIAIILYTIFKNWYMFFPLINIIILPWPLHWKCPCVWSWQPGSLAAWIWQRDSLAAWQRKVGGQASWQSSSLAARQPGSLATWHHGAGSLAAHQPSSLKLHRDHNYAIPSKQLLLFNISVIFYIERITINYVCLPVWQLFPLYPAGHWHV